MKIANELFSWFKHESICPDVRALNATIYANSTPKTIICKEFWRIKIANVLFSWLKHKFICPDVRALNATIFVHLTQKTVIGKEYCVWRLQMSYLADSSTSPYVPMLERWVLPFSYIRRQTVLLVRDIVYEDHKWIV